MANGILQGTSGTNPVTPTAATDTTVYEVPVDTFAVISVNAVNRGVTEATISVAIASTTTPTASEWIEFETSVLAKGVLERTGIVVDAGKFIVVNTSSGDFTVMVYGIETATA